MSDTPNTPPGEPLEERMATLEAAFQSVAAKMGDLSEAISGLVATIRRDRRITRVLIVSVVLDLLLSAGFFFLLHRTNHTTSVAHAAAVAAQTQSEANQSVLMTTCQASNETRAEAVTLWTALINSVPQPTAQEQANATKILDDVRSVYAPKPCP